MKFANEIRELEELNEDIIESMGSSIDITRTLIELFPDVDFSDPQWGVLERPDYSIEFNLPEEEDVTSLTLHIRGNQKVIEVLRQIQTKTGWKAIEGSIGIMNLDDNPERGLNEWKEYRDLIINQVQTKKWYQFWK